MLVVDTLPWIIQLTYGQAGAFAFVCMRLPKPNKSWLLSAGEPGSQPGPGRTEPQEHDELSHGVHTRGAT